MESERDSFASFGGAYFPNNTIFDPYNARVDVGPRTAPRMLTSSCERGLVYENFIFDQAIGAGKRPRSDDDIAENEDSQSASSQRAKRMRMELPVPPLRTTWQHRMKTPPEVRASKRKGYKIENEIEFGAPLTINAIAELQMVRGQRKTTYAKKTRDPRLAGGDCSRDKHLSKDGLPKNAEK
ncbi:hypothetical protein BJ912DRAFT_1048881 [Pholiota molesta]|nr:hypothetical protein BJ912DRAFT_1048881 [Pholiota molesta]